MSVREADTEDLDQFRTHLGVVFETCMVQAGEDADANQTPIWQIDDIEYSDIPSLKAPKTMNAV
jgi:hypothetical protein